jgi:hypothetical protein
MAQSFCETGFHSPLPAVLELGPPREHVKIVVIAGAKHGRDRVCPACDRSEIALGSILLTISYLSE